jgi:hypothetical protein
VTLTTAINRFGLRGQAYFIEIYGNRSLTVEVTFLKITMLGKTAVVRIKALREVQA